MSLFRRLGRAAAFSLGRRLAGRLQPRRVILCYHSVHPNHSFRSATPEMFAAHLAWMAEHCDVVPLSALLHPNGRENARPQVAITFDDGHADNHEFAFPLLVERGFTATFYVTTGYIDRDAAVLERFAFLRRSTRSEIEPMTWGQVRELADAGMEIGAHTFSHPNLVHLERQNLAHEVAEPKTKLEVMLGRKVESFAYPFGRPNLHLNRAVVTAVQGAGFKTAVTAAGRGIRPGDSPFTLPRFFATTSIEGLASIVRGEQDLVGLILERMPQSNRKSH